MAIILANNDIIEVKVYCNMIEQYAQNVLHYKYTTSAGDPIELQEWAAAYEARVESHWKAAMSNEAFFRGLTAQRMHPNPSAYVMSFAEEGVGAVASNPLPGQVCGLCKKVTEEPGHSGVGRIFVPFPAESHNENEGFPTEAYVTLVAALGVSVSTPFALAIGTNVNVNRLVLWRRSSPGTSKVVTDIRASSRWATLRSRSYRSDFQPPPV